MAQNELDVGERKGGILGHPVGGGVPQRVQRRRGPRPVVDPLEHAVHAVVGQRSDRGTQRPPQRLPTSPGDQPLHLHLVEPQPHERVRGRRQLLGSAAAFADHRDQLPPGIDPAHRGGQQLRGPRPGRDVEGHQRSVPMRGQPGEDLVELLVGNGARHPGDQPRPVAATAFLAMRLHRVVMGARPPTAAGTVQRERVEHRPATSVAVQVVETA